MSSNSSVSKRVKERQARVKRELDKQNTSARMLSKALGGKWESKRKIITSGDMNLDFAQEVCEMLGRDMIWLTIGHNGGHKLSKTFRMLIDLCDSNPEYMDKLMDVIEMTWEIACRERLNTTNDF
ncbi:hypothetical protein [Spartinivicinus ruber]|uniref:hypothetical protein n=1 Tax=Spartinivicinus ruber TaxID=2683272 RepID=UPI0013D228A6|nr:hypothetical protein [Spartinivicinus ruber]